MDEESEQVLNAMSAAGSLLQHAADREDAQKAKVCIYLQINLPSDLKAEFDELSDAVYEVIEYDKRRSSDTILVNELEARIMLIMMEDSDKAAKAIEKKAKHEQELQASGICNAAPLTDEQIAKLPSYHSTLDKILTHLVLATAMTRVRDTVISLRLDYMLRYPVFALSVLFHRDTD